jgi:hypothetical protein
MAWLTRRVRDHGRAVPAGAGWRRACGELAQGVREGRVGWQMRESVSCRAMLLGVMGRPSVEADWLTRDDLQRLDSMFARADPRDSKPQIPDGEWFESLGRIGGGGRVAIPRLRDYLKHPSPWVRMWAAEALERIAPRARSISFLPSSGAGKPALPLRTGPRIGALSPIFAGA